MSYGHGTRCRLTNYAKAISELKGRPVFINDLENRTKEGKALVKSFLFAATKDGEIDITKKCECGMLRGLENVGKRCEYCGTLVQNTNDAVPENRLWYRKPEQLDSLINPAAWAFISHHLTIKGNNLIAWFCDRSRQLVLKDHRVLNHLESIPFERGWNSFVKNFDEVIKYFSIPKVMPKAKTRLKFEAWIEENRNGIFTDVIAIQDKGFLVLEFTGPAKWAMPSSSTGVDSVYTLLENNSGVRESSEKNIEKRIVTFYEQQVQFFATTLDVLMGGKKGVYRKTVFGDNLTHVGRAVITSNTRPYIFDDIELPWGVGCRMLEYHIYAQLRRRFTISPKAMREKFERAVTSGDKDIQEIITYILENSPDKRLHLIMVRYPTIYRGSVLYVKCPRINFDPDVKTIACGPYLCKLMNADNHLIVIYLVIDCPTYQ